MSFSLAEAIGTAILNKVQYCYSTDYRLVKNYCKQTVIWTVTKIQFVVPLAHYKKL